MSLIVGLLKNLQAFLMSLVFPAIIFAGAFYVWNHFKKERERKIFTVSFNNIDGLSKGAPVFARGLQIGKVIKTHALVNDNKVAVKILITKKDFPKPGEGTHVKIVNSIESGGGKIIELSNIRVDEDFVGKNYFVEHYGKDFYRTIEPISSKSLKHLMFDFFVLGKEFAIDTYNMITSEKTVSYAEELENSLQNTIASIEHGTLQDDVKNQINELNEKVKDSETDPRIRAKRKQEMHNQINALKHNLGTMMTVSDQYKDRQIGGIESKR